MKKFGKILAMVMVALMMMSVVAFADAAIGGTADDNGLVTLPGENVTDAYVVTATLTGLTAGEEATILVLKDGVTLSNEIQNSDIIYIDQLTVGEDESVTFTFDASAVVSADATADVYVDFYCGYSSMSSNPLKGTALIYDYVEAPAFIYGDADGSGTVANKDVTYIKRYIVNTPGVEINVKAADVDLSGTVANRDVTYIKRFIVNDPSVPSLPVIK